MANLFHPEGAYLPDCIACRTCVRVLCRMFGWHWHEVIQLRLGRQLNPIKDDVSKD